MKIDKNIPLPPKNYKLIWVNLLPDMEVGDSILVPLLTDNNKNIESTSIASRAGAWGRKYGGKKFVSRRQEEGVRLWRTK